MCDLCVMICAVKVINIVMLWHLYIFVCFNQIHLLHIIFYVSSCPVLYIILKYN